MAHRAPSPPPVAALKDDNIREILLGLPSSASLARAVPNIPDWGRVASEPGFSESFRARHPSSPLLGIYTPDDPRPIFHPFCPDVDDKARDLKADDDIAAVIGLGDYMLTKLKSGVRWRLRDCRNGVLLLYRPDDNSLCVYNPVSRSSRGRQPFVRIHPRPDDVTEFLVDCLLHGNDQRLAVDSFRVVSVQRRRREIRAVEYDSSTLRWRCHPWMGHANDGLSRKPAWDTPMYAAGQIFWEYGPAYVFVLDTRTMEFSSCSLPRELDDMQFYSIGEIEDGRGYLVCLRGLRSEEKNTVRRLQVWALGAGNVMELELKKEIPMSQLLGVHYSTQVCRVKTVINGLVVLSYPWGRPLLVVDLHKESLLATFKLKFSGRGYPYQLSWPQAIVSEPAPPLEDNNNIDNTVPTSDGTRRSSHDVVESVHEERDDGECSKLSPGNKIKEPPTLSSLDNTCFQSQYMDPPDVNEGSVNEASSCENHHTLKSPDKLKDDEPRQRKKRKTNGTSNACLEETTTGHQDQNMPSLSSCNPLVVESETLSATAVPQKNLEVLSRNISVGQQTTSQDKPLNEDVLNCPQRGGPPKKSRCKATHPNGARKTRSSHVVHDTSSVVAETTTTPAVCQTNLRATCRKISMGRPATHEKPVCEKKFTCPVCRICYDLEKTMKRHLYTHGRKNFFCPDESCKRAFHEVYKRDRHFREVHGQGKCFTCTCGMMFTREENLKSHFKRIHNSRETRLPCQFEGCTEEFDDKHARKTHEKSSVHVEVDTLGTERVKCRFKGCTSTFSMRKLHNRHYKKFHKKTSASRGEAGRTRKKKTKV